MEKVKVFLISEDTLKTDSIINDNVDPQYIRVAIDSAQNIGLCELIGKKMLDKICGMVEDNTILTEGNKKYKELLDDYIEPYLLYKTCSEITIPLAYKYRNSGIVQTNDEPSQNTGMQDSKTMKSYYDDRASFFATQIKRWLVENNLVEQSCKEFKNNPGYNTGIYLG